MGSCSTTPRPGCDTVRDLTFDDAPLAQKVVGEATPTQILSQPDEIDAVDTRRRPTAVATPGSSV